MSKAKNRLVVVGAGDHAKVILEVLRSMAKFEVVGFTDPGSSKRSVLGAPVLGGDEILPNLVAQGVRAAVIALGANSLRERIGKNLLAMGFSLPVIVHPSACISPSARIGQGSVVMPGVIINALAEIGDLTIINTGAIVEHDNLIGPAAHIAPGVALAGRVRVGSRTLIGVGSVVRPDVSIGDDCIVGAGSAVVADVPSGVTVAGVPARTLVRK